MITLLLNDFYKKIMIWFVEFQKWKLLFSAISFLLYIFNFQELPLEVDFPDMIFF